MVHQMTSLTHLTKQQALRAFGLFIIVLALFSGAFDLVCITLGQKRYLLAGLMWTPGLAALATLKLLGLSVRSLAWNWGDSRYHVAGYVLPFAYGVVAYGILWGFELVDFPDPAALKKIARYYGLVDWSSAQILVFYTVISATVGVLWPFMTALGAEIGWRGFLAPLLLPHLGFARVALVSGLLWALWSLPIILFTDYNAGPRDLVLQVINYSVLVTGLSFLHLYLRLKARSLWPAVTLHAAHHVWVMWIAETLALENETSWRWAHEFGFVLPTVVLLLGIVVWRRAVLEGLTDPH